MSFRASLTSPSAASKKLAPWAALPIFVEFPLRTRIVYRTLPAPCMDSKLSDIFRDAILKPNLSRLS
ncbi:MAG: hypothetical protein QXK88_10535 [Desulfurococcaceae archaeon]